MPKELTQLYEVCATLEGFEKPLTTHIDQEEYDRLVDVLEEREVEDLAFVGISEARGLEAYFNLDRTLYINLLEYLCGIAQVEKQKALSEAEEEKLFEERMESDKPVLMWIWTAADKEPQLYYEVSYHEWDAIRMALGLNNRRCIGFTDSDGERVIIPLKNLIAVEVCDEFFHEEDTILRFAEKYSKEKRGEEPLEIPVS
jgi:hypothetical protein